MKLGSLWQATAAPGTPKARAWSRTPGLRAVLVSLVPVVVALRVVEGQGELLAGQRGGDISRVRAGKLRHPRSFGSLELCVGDLLGGAGEEAGDDGGHDGDHHWEDGGCDHALERSRSKRPDRVCVSYLLGLRGDSR